MVVVSAGSCVRTVSLMASPSRRPNAIYCSNILQSLQLFPTSRHATIMLTFSFTLIEARVLKKMAIARQPNI